MPRIIFPIALSLLLSACASVEKVSLYSGPQLPSDQEVQILLPENFDVIEANGYKVPQSKLRFRTNQLPLVLPPGEHTIAIKYHDVWDIDDENHETVTSGNIIFKLSGQKGEIFHIQYPSLNNLETALEFSMSPTIALKSQHQEIKGSHLAKENPLVFNQTESKNVRYPQLEQLKFWWKQATQYEREAFLDWHSNQD